MDVPLCFAHPAGAVGVERAMKFVDYHDMTAVPFLPAIVAGELFNEAFFHGGKQVGL